MTNKHFSKIIIILFLLSSMGISKMIAQGEVPEKLTILPYETHQTVIGFGASLAYYEGWLNAHPRRLEIYQAIFGELSLDILRVRNAYDYDPEMIGRVEEYMAAAENVLGHPISLFSTSWGPPGYMKNTGDRKNGGSLRYTTGPGGVKIDYAGFAHWWNKSLDEYGSRGIFPTYISIQNEPDFSATWESCLFNPRETINSSDTIAGYDKALDAVYDTLLTRANKPLILGPETVGIGYNRVQNYVNALDLSKLDAISHHLYHGVDENNPYASSDFSKVGDFHPEIPHIQTEYSRGDWFSLAGLIYKSFYDEKVVAYLYWDLIWNEGGLVQLDNPWNPAQWADPQKGYTKTKDFYAFKQFSAYIHPGWKMVNHSLSGSDGVALTFISPSGDSATTVLINRSKTDDLTVHMEVPGYRITESFIYSTSELENCELKGEVVDSLVTLIPHSIATVDMRITTYDPADDTEAPSKPAGLHIYEITNSSISSAWSPSNDNIGVDGYRVFVDGLLKGTTQDTSFVIAGLESERSYEIAISAFDNAGNESEKSDPVNGTTLYRDNEVPSTPSGVIIKEVGTSFISLVWSASSDNEGVEGYRIYLNGLLQVTTTDTAFVVTGLEANRSYEITLAAFDQAGNESEKSAPEFVTTLYFDRVAPLLNATSSIYQEGTVVLVCSEEGVVYLVPENTSKNLPSIREVLMDSVEVAARAAANLFISGLENGVYWLYAADSAQNISEPEALTVLGVGIESFGFQSFEVYPNPFSESAIFKFSLTKGQDMWLTLMDSKGRVVRSESLGHLVTGVQEVILPRDGLAEGLYFFRLENQDHKGHSGRVLIGD